MKKSLLNWIITLSILLVCVCLLPTKANAASVSDLTFTLNDDDESYSVFACNEYASGNLIIPATYNSKPVTSIGDAAFYNCTSLTSITIPDSVTTIGDSAFSYCTSLTSITIPDSVTSIGGSVFSGCSGLETMTLPFVTQYRSPNRYPFGYFFGEVSYDGSVRTSQRYFYTIAANGGVRQEYGYVTYYIPANLKTVVVTGNNLEEFAFENCTNPTEIILGEHVTSICDYAFWDYPGLTSITIPDSVTSICDYAFYDCTSLTSITIPDSVTSSIGYNAFVNCTSLTNVTIGNGVTGIGTEAFAGCSGLTSITIPASVNSIGFAAFTGCSSLESITIPFVGDSRKTSSDRYQYPFGYIFGEYSYTGSIATKQSYYGSSMSSTTTTTFYIPVSLKSVTVTESNILHGAFYGCKTLTNVTIGDGITSIGASAFKDCTELTSITIPNSVTIIGDWAFSACPNKLFNISDNVKYLGNENNPYMVLVKASSTDLPSVTIHPDTKIIASYAFSNCTSITEIAIPDGAIRIDSYAFSDCYDLTSITIPGSVTSIGASAFENCTELTCITIPNSVTSIESYTFYNCKNLRSIIIPDSVTSIGAHAFYNCRMESITIPDSVTVIGMTAFYYCSSLKEVHITDIAAWCEISFSNYYSNPLVYGHNLYLNGKLVKNLVIPDSVTVIRNYAFYSCRSLTSINIGDGVTAIGASAFYDCDGLTNVSVGDSAVSVGSDAFSGCGNLLSIDIPDSISTIGRAAFYDCHSMVAIFYRGPASVKDEISVADNNYYFTNAQWHYEIKDATFAESDCYYCEECENYLLPDGTPATAIVTFLNWDGTKLAEYRLHSNQAVIIPANPTKDADETYAYTFAGWDSEVATNCTGNATYTATYTPTYIDYTVEFKDWDGKVLSTKTYHWGDKVTAPANPTRAADNTYTYAFKRWDKEVATTCTGNATYTAIYEATYIDYTIVFKDWDGKVLSTTTYHWGDKVTAPANPTRAADNAYTYTFAGWNKTVVNCAGNATYNATYTPTYVNYTVVFKDWDGKVLSTKSYHWGDKVTTPANPTRAADNTYTYLFKSWDKTVVNCAGNATYNATYTPTYINYTVVFKNWDGKVLSTKTYHWGDKVTTPANPTRDADNACTYVFDCWDKPVVNCVGDATYTATYIANDINYVIVFKDWDGIQLSYWTYHWGEDVIAYDTPTRDPDNTYTYTFVGWDKEIVNCAGDATYTAVYEATYIDYTAVYKDWDGAVLSTVIYHWDDELTAPANPTRPADDTYTYIFTGWNVDFVNAEGTVTHYSATYSESYIYYTVVFKDWDGTILSSNTYHCGETVTTPAKPTRPADNTYTYTFAGWDDYVGACTGNATYTATYKSTYINYKVTFKNWDGKVILDKTYHWGDAITVPRNPTRAADYTYTYTFAGWDSDVAANCAGNATYTATYTPTYINYTVVFKNWDGTVISTNIYHYGDEISVPVNPTKPGNNQETYTFYSWKSDLDDISWDNQDAVICVGNVTYVAAYASDYISYSVVFKDWDGTVISNAYHSYWWGDTINVPENPTRAADNTYTYTFAGWDKPVVNCAGDAIYTATYTPTYIDYTITFKNWDGNILSIKAYHYGDKIVVPANPTRAADNTYTYTFAGWDKEVVQCAGNLEYIATFNATHYHTYVRSRITDPTCADKGYTTYICSCGDMYKSEYTDSKGHTYTNDSDTTCNSCGTKSYPGGNTLVKENGIWYHVVNRQKVTDTTLVYYGGYWFYVKNGEVDWTSNTLCKWNGMWFHVKDGKKVNDTTLVKYGGYWFYVKDGQVDFKATTLCYYGGYWFYVKNGEVDWTSNTLCKWNGMWFHVKDGKKVNDTTLVKYGGYWFYVKDGQVDFKATTLCYYGGYWFYVKNGEVDWTSNTLCKWNGMWFHVKDGKKVNDTTLVYYGGYWFYVNNGQVDFNYSGKVLYNGKYYTIKKGVKV